MLTTVHSNREPLVTTVRHRTEERAPTTDLLPVVRAVPIGLHRKRSIKVADVPLLSPVQVAEANIMVGANITRVAANITDRPKTSKVLKGLQNFGSPLSCT